MQRRMQERKQIPFGNDNKELNLRIALTECGPFKTAFDRGSEVG